MEGDADEPKLTKKDFDLVLYRRYGGLIKNFGKEVTGDFSPEEALSRQELDLVIVLTTFPNTPTVTPDASRRLHSRMIEVKSKLYKRSITDRFKVALDQLSARRVIDTIDGEIEKIELEKEKPDGKPQEGDARIVNYFKAAKEVAQLAAALEQEKS